MKYLIGQLASIMTGRNEKNLRILLKFFLLLALMIIIYSIVFHHLMLREGKQHSWITGFYWTLTVMSTLGFGDITFGSDLGRLFSMIVLLSGVIFLLIILPFTFIQFFYAPWLEAQSKLRAPKALTDPVANHIVLTSHSSVTMSLVEKLKLFRYAYVILCEDISKALELVDHSYQVVVGDLGDPETYKRVRVDKAALVVAENDDMINTNIAFAVREISETVPIAASAEMPDSVDILHLAGSTHVFQFSELLGQSLARRVLSAKAMENIVGEINGLFFSEVPAMKTPLVGQSLEQSRLRETTGVTVAGLWEQGAFNIPGAQTVVHDTTVLFLAGSTHHLENFDAKFGSDFAIETPVLIIGGGRVGRAAAATLDKRHLDYRIVEKNKRLIQNDRYILGSAADIDTLQKAGIQRAPSVIITTHDNPANIYLTIYCRKLRPNAQIISRATLDRSISKLYTAGADLVISQASFAADTLMNLLKPNRMLILAEGLNLFQTEVTPVLVGQTLQESHIRRKSGCSVVALRRGKERIINPEPTLRFHEEDELILLGSDPSEKRFFDIYAVR